jgi:hypothetical protein
MAVNFDTTKPLRLKVKLPLAIARLERTVAYKKPLEDPSCDKGDPKGLISRTFKYKRGGDPVVVKVTCHAKVMVGYLKALRKETGIQVTVSSDSMYSGSYRTWDQQNTLYTMYKNGTGYMAAHPCSGYHRQGRALDILDATKAEQQAINSVRVDGLRFFNGAGFGDPRHNTLGAYG